MLNDEFFTEKLNRIKEKGLFRENKTLFHSGVVEIDFEGRRLINFASNSYLGLHREEEMMQFAAQSCLENGTSATASRLVSGTLDLHDNLEKSICDWKNAEAAMVFNSGFQANNGVLAAIADKDTLILADRLVHASMIDGIRLSGAKFVRFKHNNMADLESLLIKHAKYSKIMIFEI